MAETLITFNAFNDDPTILSVHAQNERLNSITFDAFEDEPTLLSEQEQSARFETIAAALGTCSVPAPALV